MSADNRQKIIEAFSRLKKRVLLYAQASIETEQQYEAFRKLVLDDWGETERKVRKGQALNE